MYKICLVEDEIALSNVVKLYLERAGYEVVVFSKGNDAINYIGNKVDLWILDIMLGDDVSGYNVIKQIREKDENVPVIFTSARDQEIDKIFGLELGSDDYMTKPYSSKELVLRVNNMIKRVYKDKEKKDSIINYEDYQIDLEKRIVTLNKKEIKLTTLEFDLVVLFIKNKGKSFSREEILNTIWGEDYFGTDRVVDDLVRRVRKRLSMLKIEAIYGYGYRLL
ncbi:MAG: response regulator transcription factor [Bacilli bacterium]|nr:response regulator transcription factor [Bacilli bacterium]